MDTIYSQVKNILYDCIIYQSTQKDSDGDYKIFAESQSLSQSVELKKNLKYTKANIKIIQLIDNKFRIKINDCYLFIGYYVTTDKYQYVYSCHKFKNNFNQRTIFEIVKTGSQNQNKYLIKDCLFGCYLFIGQDFNQKGFRVIYASQIIEELQSAQFQIKDRQLQNKQLTKAINENVNQMSVFSDQQQQNVIINNLQQLLQYKFTLHDFYYKSLIIQNSRINPTINNQIIAVDPKKSLFKGQQIKQIVIQHIENNHVRLKLGKKYLYPTHLVGIQLQHQVFLCTQLINNFDVRTRWEIIIKHNQTPINNKQTIIKSNKSIIQFKDPLYNSYLYVDPNIDQQGYRRLYTMKGIQDNQRSYFYLKNPKINIDVFGRSFSSIKSVNQEYQQLQQAEQNYFKDLVNVNKQFNQGFRYFVKQTEEKQQQSDKSDKNQDDRSKDKLKQVQNSNKNVNINDNFTASQQSQFVFKSNKQATQNKINSLRFDASDLKPIHIYQTTININSTTNKQSQQHDYLLQLSKRTLYQSSILSGSLLVVQTKQEQQMQEKRRYPQSQQSFYQSHQNSNILNLLEQSNSDSFTIQSQFKFNSNQNQSTYKLDISQDKISYQQE